VTTWSVPVPDFALFRIDLDGTRPPAEIPATGPRVLLATAGDLYVGESIDGMPIDLPAGSAAYAPADTGALKVAGTGQLFVAAVPA
jgi:mannose-6-phosphate isomerase